MPEIEILLTPSCANGRLAEQRVRALVAAFASGSTVAVVDVTAHPEAMARFAGSPTVLVDGADLEPGVRPVDGFA
jgi:hypothetical protein